METATINEHENSNDKEQEINLFVEQIKREQEQRQATRQDSTLSLIGLEKEQQAEPSIKPSIAESERFIQFLNERFNLNLRNDLIVLIHETKPNTRGFFRSVNCAKIWKEPSESKSETSFKQQESHEKPLNSITLSSHELKQEPYMVLAHELAHYINFINNINDTSKNGVYHNKEFKKQAEKLLLLIAERDKLRGYAYTTATKEFNEMLQEEFKPSETAFKIFQEIDETRGKEKTRLLKFVCGCGCIIRCAKNQDKPLKAICQYCDYEFKEVLR